MTLVSALLGANRDDHNDLSSNYINVKVHIPLSDETKRAYPILSIALLHQRNPLSTNMLLALVGNLFPPPPHSSYRILLYRVLSLSLSLFFSHTHTHASIFHYPSLLRLLTIDSPLFAPDRFRFSLTNWSSSSWRSWNVSMAASWCWSPLCNSPMATLDE